MLHLLFFVDFSLEPSDDLCGETLLSVGLGAVAIMQEESFD